MYISSAIRLETPPEQIPQPEIPPGGPEEMPDQRPIEVPEPAPVEMPPGQPPEMGHGKYNI